MLSISERNFYNDLGSHVCKNYACLKLQALRQYSETFIALKVWIFVNYSILVYKLCILVKCIYLSLFLFFYIDIMTRCGNTGFPWSVFSRISKESYPYFPVFGQILWFCPITGKYEYDSLGKYGSEKDHILAYFTHCFPIAEVL